MSAPATSSSLDVAYWFFQRAEKENIYLETEKLHNLLFLAQSRYAQMYSQGILMPCVFLCDEHGFFEPTLKKIFAQGRPYMPPIILGQRISSFLEQIWLEYSHLSSAQFKQLLMRIPAYNECYRSGTPIMQFTDSLIDKSVSYDRMYESLPQEPFKKKFLVSQNGPVWVSQWKPKKINPNNNKDYIHD